jgi:hypothetical protein
MMTMMIQMIMPHRSETPVSLLFYSLCYAAANYIWNEGWIAARSLPMRTEQ